MILIFIMIFSLFACNAAGILYGNDFFGDDADGEDNLLKNQGEEQNESENPPPAPLPPATLPPVPKVITQTYIMAKVSLNIRNNSSFSSKIVGKTDKNDMLLYIGRQDNWYITVYKDKTAYVSASSLYTKLVEIEKGNERIEAVLNIGYPLLGYPYVWGSARYHWGNGALNTNYIHGRYDCSALVQYMYYKGANVKLGLTTREQVLQGTTISRNDIKRGDLLFFTNSSRNNLSGLERVGHVAVYLGDNYILHTASDYAVIEPITPQRWNYYITAKRFV